MKILSSSILYKKGFTLIELIVGMTIFALGMTAILAMLTAAIDTAAISKNEIIAANLLREQVELVKNNRNTNIKSFTYWNNAFINNSSDTELTPGTYIIENNFSESEVAYNDTHMTASPIYFEKKNLPSDQKDIFDQFQLYRDALGRYTHKTTSESTHFAVYTTITPLRFSSPSGNIEPKDPTGTHYQGYQIDARVLVKTGGNYREYDLKTLITDWQR